jgi:hypothetical protein
MHKLFCLMFIFIVLFGVIKITQGASNNPSITVPYSANVPNVDGQWTTTAEWMNASEYKLTIKDWTAYIRTERNSSHLFILVDFTSDQTGSISDSIATYDYCGIFFDTLDDGGNYPKSDDYLLSHYYSSFYASSGLHTYISQGTGLNKEENNWEEIATPQGFSLERGFSSLNDPYESKSHRVYEASAPLAFLGYKDTIGFYIFVRDANSGSGLVGNILEFPNGAGGRSTRSDAMADLIAPAPKNWGNLVFADSSTSTSPTPTGSVPPTQNPTPSPTDGPKPLVPLTSLIIIIAAAGIAIVLLVGLRRSKYRLKSS